MELKVTNKYHHNHLNWKELQNCNQLNKSIQELLFVNKYLETACFPVLKDNIQSQTFIISSKMFVEGSKKLRKTLHDFTIFVNDLKIKCNQAFLCCLSQRISRVVFNDSTLTEFSFNDVLNENLFISLVNILKGEFF
jgi:hypothetical protein